MTEKVLVVGGGIVGLTAAYFSAKKGNDVTLVESSPELGGLLKSSQSDFGYFDYGVHIASQTNVEALDSFLFADTQQWLHRFDVQESGSFFNSSLTEFSPFLNINALADDYCHKASAELVQFNAEQSYENLAQLITAEYGETAYQHAFLPFVRQTFGAEPGNLPAYYIYFFDMYRVVAFDQATSEQLKGIDYLNNRLGFHQHTKGAPKYYPKEGGIGAWTAHLQQQAIEAGVQFVTESSVSAIKPTDIGSEVTFGTKTVEVDKLIWTISSALLTRFLPLTTQLKRPNFRKTALFDYVYQKPLNTPCKYINNFDAAHLSTRLTCYQNLTPGSEFYATTVEVLTDDVSEPEQLLDKVSSELMAMGLVDTNNKCLFNQYRPVAEGFPVITLENDQLLKQLNQEIANKYPNITLLGRSSSKGFFMAELLINAYQACV